MNKKWAEAVAAPTRRWRRAMSGFARIVRGAWLGALFAMAASAHAGDAAALDKVIFGTNWLAEAEHGGFYQALADGTYEKYGLDVTIVQGGPQSANQALLMADKIDFYMSGNLLVPFSAAEQGIPV